MPFALWRQKAPSNLLVSETDVRYVFCRYVDRELRCDGSNNGRICTRQEECGAVQCSAVRCGAVRNDTCLYWIKGRGRYEIGYLCALHTRGWR